MLAVGLVFVVAATTITFAASVRVAHHRASAAADLAALAAAWHTWDGEAVACERAADVTARNGARLVACRLDGLDAVVTVVFLAGAGWGAVRASARAGPVE
jgi:secretion/DNA translocation related TadE-like protein